MPGKTYHTAKAAKQFAHSIATVLRDFQDSRISDSPWFGVGGDGSTDKTKKEKHTVVVRYMDQKPAHIRWAEQTQRLRELGVGFRELPAPVGQLDLSPLEKLGARKAMLGKGSFKIVTEYYDLPSVFVDDSRDGESHDAQAVIVAYGRLFERRGLRSGFNSWKERLANVNFDGAMMGRLTGAVGQIRRAVVAKDALIATWAQACCFLSLSD